jgi:thiamine pyrophosphokinase
LVTCLRGNAIVHVLIFANGVIVDPDNARRCVERADLLICADGGVHHARTIGVRPHVLIGDMDSLSAALRAELEAEGAELIVRPAHKDETDLELALLYAVDRGATRITVLGALGKRTDHALANLMLLAHPRLVGVDVRVISGEQEILLVRQAATFDGTRGDLMSLLPIGGDAHGIVTRGLEYPLRDETLYFGPARGVSNVFTTSRPSVRLRSGVLLAVHTRSPSPDPSPETRGGGCLAPAAQRGV